MEICIRQHFHVELDRLLMAFLEKRFLDVGLYGLFECMGLQNTCATFQPGLQMAKLDYFFYFGESDGIFISIRFSYICVRSFIFESNAKYLIRTNY